MLRVFCEVDAKSFFCEFLSYLLLFKGRIPERGRERVDVVGLKVFDKSLSRLETLRSTPPFFQLHFLLRLILMENCLKSFKMREKHFAEMGLFI